MAGTIDPPSLAFLLAENRNQPMHVAGLQLFETPDDATPDFARQLFEHALAVEEVAPLFLKRPRRSVSTLGQWAWTEDRDFDVEHHLRHNALPRPGRVRELLELVSRLHSTMLARERPLWEAHVIEGLDDGRVAMYTKLHHALVDGVSAMRLMQSVLSTDPDERDMELFFSAHAVGGRPRRTKQPAEHNQPGRGSGGRRPTALGVAADAAGLPGALVRTLTKGVRNEASSVSLHAPRTMFNVPITGSRRVAAQKWPLERLRAIKDASGTTLNDVVLAMCSGAIRSYLLEQGALPDAPLVSMVPVGLNARQSHLASAEGGNSVGAVMVQLATDLPDPADRLTTIHRSMADGKSALTGMTPMQVLAMSAIGMAPAIVLPALRLQGIARPPFNLIISNVPGPREPQYLNGARLVGTYPVSIPIQGMALNITCNSYAEQMCFGLTGCRRSVPHLQRLLTHLDDELAALEKAAGVR